MSLLEVDGRHQALRQSRRGRRRLAERRAAASCAPIIGPNGAGKTTFFNLISGFFPPSAARSCFDGRDVTRLSAQSGSRCGMARTFQITEIFPELSVRENVRIGVEVGRGLPPAPVDQPRRERCERAATSTRSLALAGLTGKADRLVGELAHGDQRAAEIAMALALRPRLLLLDEPTAGMGDQETYDSHPARSADLHRDGTHHRADRARHARRLPSRRPHHRARPGRAARRRHAAGDRRQRGGAGRLSGEGGMSAALDGRGPPHLSTARATFCTASASRSPRARSPRCSAATAPARRRRCAASWD